MLIIVVGSIFTTKAQSFGEEKVAFANYLKRMYNSSPFEGVKVIEDYDNNYLVSVLSLEIAKYSSQSTMNRVAQVKAQSQANTFFNGSVIKMDFVVKTTEKRSENATDITVETMESIKENSIGFVKRMELLSNFKIENDSRMLFIYYKKIEDE